MHKNYHDFIEFLDTIPENTSLYPYIYLTRHSNSKYKLEVVINNSYCDENINVYLISDTEFDLFIKDLELIRKCELYVKNIQNCFIDIYDKVLNDKVKSLANILIRNNTCESHDLMLKLTFSIEGKDINITFIDDCTILDEYIKYFFGKKLINTDTKFVIYQQFNDARLKLTNILPSEVLNSIKCNFVEQTIPITPNEGLYKITCIKKSTIFDVDEKIGIKKQLDSHKIKITQTIYYLEPSSKDDFSAKLDKSIDEIYAFSKYSIDQYEGDNISISLLNEDKIDKYIIINLSKLQEFNKEKPCDISSEIKILATNALDKKIKTPSARESKTAVEKFPVVLSSTPSPTSTHNSITISTSPPATSPAASSNHDVRSLIRKFELSI